MIKSKTATHVHNHGVLIWKPKYPWGDEGIMPDEIDLARALEGEWHITRAVPGQATMAGLAVFSPAKDALHYSERGQMVLNDGQTFDFSRSYIYRFLPARMDVLFNEAPPRLFQSVKLTRDGAHIIGDGAHTCQPDTYSSRYRFSLPSAFSITHQVEGPRKSYMIKTKFTRI